MTKEIDNYNEMARAIISIIQSPKSEIALETLNIISVIIGSYNSSERIVVLSAILSEVRKLVSA